MAETLESFLDRQLRVVDESGKNTRTIRLCVADTGETFERWDSPLRVEEQGPGAERLAHDIEELVRGYAETFPAKSRVQMKIVAEDGEGSARGIHVKTVAGTNQDAKRSILGGDTSLAEGARIHVETTRHLMNSMVSHINLLSQHNLQQMQQNQQLMLMLANERLEAAQNVDDSKAQQEQMMDILGRLSQGAGPLVQLIVDGMVKNGADRAAAQAAANAATAAARAASATNQPNPSNGSNGTHN